jgi:hypothetical protein
MQKPSRFGVGVGSKKRWLRPIVNPAVHPVAFGGDAELVRRHRQ